MKLFGLLSLLVVVGIAGWLLADSALAPSSDGESGDSYRDAVDVAREAAGTLSGGVEIYDGISVSHESIIVDVSGRGLSGSLKAEVRLLSDLEVLDISNNEFTALPAEIGQLSQLRILNLANNPLNGLPHELGNLQKLEILDLRGTNYSMTDLEIIRQQLPSSVDVFVD